jgi:hypothetical protein
MPASNDTGSPWLGLGKTTTTLHAHHTDVCATSSWPVNDRVNSRAEKDQSFNFLLRGHTANYARHETPPVAQPAYTEYGRAQTYDAKALCVYRRRTYKH